MFDFVISSSFDSISVNVDYFIGFLTFWVVFYSFRLDYVLLDYIVCLMFNIYMGKGCD